jgi:hypothetical protein
MLHSSFHVNVEWGTSLTHCRINLMLLIAL